jgi:hypothetical protein
LFASPSNILKRISFNVKDSPNLLCRRTVFGRRRIEFKTSALNRPEACQKGSWVGSCSRRTADFSELDGILQANLVHSDVYDELQEFIWQIRDRHGSGRC